MSPVLDIAAIAGTLAVAERNSVPVPAFTDANPFLDMDAAYEAQWLGIERRIGRGETLLGAKLGLTSRVMRHALGIHEPLYGWITSAMIAPYGERLSIDGLIAPRAEPEIAFLLGSDLPAPASVSSVLAATEAVFGVIEIIDKRYASTYRPADAVADNLGAARVAIGSRLRSPREVCDLRLLGCVFRNRGVVVGTAAGGSALGHPAAAVAWLVNALARRDKHLPAGSIVLSGGLTIPVSIPPGGVFSAEFDGLGTVEVYR